MTANNNAGRTNNSTFTLTADSAAPAGGALAVNGVAASGGGTQSYDNDGSFTIGLRTDYTDTTSGLATSRPARTARSPPTPAPATAAEHARRHAGLQRTGDGLLPLQH